LEKGLITKKGSWFFLNEERIAQGYDKAKEFILNNTEVYLKLREEVLK
jgi:hypothetical protein